MCGIAGLLTRTQPTESLEMAARHMANAIGHRGPDDFGVWSDAGCGVAVAHRRLSIVDLSPAGHQPMTSHDGRFVVVFNGEVYNHMELRAELEGGGAAPPWRGHSDTETLLAAIVAWGVEATLKRLVGMFAFALWDRSSRQLVLARDRLGEKPLYYGWQGDTFMFASELKALRVHPEFRPEVDRDVLSLYLRHNYVPAPYSIYKGIFKLAPGAFLTLCEADQRGVLPRLTLYWRAFDAAIQPVREFPDDVAAVDELDNRLRRSIAGQMVADVPLGAFLSGGIDSSVVVALMAAQASRPVKTFTIGFHESSYNEAEQAHAVAAHLGCEHTELYVTPEQAMAVIPRLPSLYDEPFADSSQIPTFLVAQLARQHVTVSLSGDGGDELFSGYNRYLWASRIWQYCRVTPHALRASLAKAMTRPSPGAWNRLFDMARFAVPAGLRYANPGDKLHKLAEMLGAHSPEEVYLSLVSQWKRPADIVRGAVELPTVLTDSEQWPPLADFTSRMMYLDQMSYMPDDILVKVDRAAMGVSLETRVPMLDHRLVEFAWRLPMRMKIRNGQSKWLLRQVLYRYVPKELIERPKMGFGVPIDSWLRGPLKDWAEALLSRERLERDGYFNADPIRARWEEHLTGRRNWAYHIWTVLMFQAWLSATTNKFQGE
jgi:asparagine synthase (glutamine-hydrolysing)